MHYFFDTSALISAYLNDEPDHQWAREFYIKALEESHSKTGAGFGIDKLIVSSILKYELSKVFRDKNRSDLTERIEIENALVIKVDAQILRKAADFMDKHHLESLDAIHLACAIQAKEKYGDILFICRDHKLVSAAEKEGLQTPTINHVK